MPKVTIIMPSLNVVKYIKNCMDSVLTQTLQDIEILAIDAGSEDGTLEVLQEYAESDKRIKIIHSDRKSYGYQLNIGISRAQGEYVGVVETDDRISPDMIRTLYERAQEIQVDYVKGYARSFMEIAPEITVSNRIISTASSDEVDRVIIPKKNPKLFVTDRFLWMGIYRSDFIKAIKLNESPGAAFQDIGFMFQAISNADRAIYLDKEVYFYRQDNVGASSHDARGFHYLVEEYAYVEQFLEGKDREWCHVYYEKMLNQSLGRFRMMAVSGIFWEGAVLDIEILRKRLSAAIEGGLLNLEKLDKGTGKLLGLFMSGARDIYAYYAEEFQKKKRVVYDMLEVIKNHPVIIFGCGEIGKFIHALLENRLSGIVAAYCDNAVSFWDTKIQGITVLSPNMAVCRYPDAAYIITGRKSAETMRQQLCELGVADRHICIFQEEMDIMLLRVK